jgi:hypothetical protein
LSGLTTFPAQVFSPPPSFVSPHLLPRSPFDDRDSATAPSSSSSSRQAVTQSSSARRRRQSRAQAKQSSRQNRAARWEQAEHMQGDGAQAVGLGQVTAGPLERGRGAERLEPLWRLRGAPHLRAQPWSRAPPAPMAAATAGRAPKPPHPATIDPPPPQTLL